MKHKRDTAIDILKGIAIILVIIGHWLTDDSIFHTYIYSFHLPLFFLISGLYFRPKPIIAQVRRDAKLLLLPYLLIVLLRTANLLVLGQEPTGQVIQKAFYSAIFVRFTEGTVFGHEVFSIGPGWFLPALFWIRFLFNLLHKYAKEISLGIGAIGLSLLAMYCNSSLITLPFAILVGMSNLIYYYLGYITSQYNVTLILQKHHLISTSTSLLLWLLLAPFSHLSTSMQPLTWSYPLDLFIALAGIIGFYGIAQWIDRKGYNWIKSQLNLWGRYSLVALTFHSIPLFGLSNWVHTSTLILYNRLGIPLIGESLPQLLISLLIPYLAILIIPKTKWGRALFSISTPNT